MKRDDTSASSRATDRAGAEPFDGDTVAFLRDLMANEPGGFPGLVTDFVEEAATSLAAVRTAVVAADTATMVRELHSVTGAAAAVGAHRLAHACRHVEEELRAGAPTMEAEALIAIETEFRRVRAWVRDQPQG